MPEPSVEDTVLILKGLLQKYESFHNVKYTDKAILSASSLAKQYVRYLMLYFVYGLSLQISN